MDDTMSQEPPAKRLKPSDTVACAECRARKTKCNRELPCDACIRRGMPQDCKPELRKYPPSLGGLSSTVELLTQRVARLEAHMLASQVQQQQQQQQPQQPDALVNISGSDAGQASFLQSHGPGLPSLVSNSQQNNAGFDPSASISQARIQTQPQPQSQVSPPLQSAPTYTQAKQAPSEHAEDLSHVVSGKAAAKDFDILHATRQTPNGATASLNSALRHHSSSSPYPSIRAVVPVATGSWQSSLLLALQTHLPPIDEVRKAFQLYVEYRRWSLPAVNCAQLQAEIDELELLLRQGHFLSIDPAWVALIFIVMALGSVSAYICSDAPANDEQYAFASRMAEACDGAMAAANWAEHPQIRVIQVLILRVRWNDHMDPDSGLFVHGSKVQAIRPGIALAYAEALGLNMLGSDRNTMPEHDLALPEHPCEFRRQMGLRIWSNLESTFLVNGAKTDLASDSVAFDVCPDADLSFELSAPRDHAQTWETAWQEFHLALTTDASMGMKKAAGASRAELNSVEEQCHSSIASFKGLIDSLPDKGLTPFWNNRESLYTGLTIFEWGLRLRLRRAAFNAADAKKARAGALDQAAIEAAVTLGQASTKSTAIHVIRTNPLIGLYMLNAAVVLCVALRSGNVGAADSAEGSGAVVDLADLVLRIISAIAEHGRASLNPPIVTNAQKAIDALFRLMKRLVQPSDDPSHQAQAQAQEGQLLSVLARLAELSTSPEAVAVMLEAAAAKQQQQEQQEISQRQQMQLHLDPHHFQYTNGNGFQEPLSNMPTPSFESLALLDGLDFVKWTESGFMNGWDSNGLL